MNDYHLVHEEIRQIDGHIVNGEGVYGAVVASDEKGVAKQERAYACADRHGEEVGLCQAACGDVVAQKGDEEFGFEVDRDHSHVSWSKESVTTGLAGLGE
ncbi:hypothetical protein GOP47_0021440 [Adiantum capillus-veneris]|uniref:Uncharacterized protein n=1 Tax=Adiantum capillus-veneris TaxID=13818 RepID=A0A9D4U7H9_ADICA|nr:hypothetical protein GOP47_0021440 [Adiantum capillus-veneris]